MRTDANDDLPWLSRPGRHMLVAGHAVARLRAWPGRSLQRRLTSRRRAVSVCAIAEAHSASRDLIACRNRVDPDHRLPMERIAGITEWDLVYALFWLTGRPEPVVMRFPRLLEERYFAYIQVLLLRLTGGEVPPALAAAVAGFAATGQALVDRDFAAKQALLDGMGDAGALMARVAGHWSRRRRAGFYQACAPQHAGHDVSNDLAVDWQLACIANARGLAAPAPHAWRW